MVLPFITIPLAMWTWFFLPALPFSDRQKRSEWLQGISLFYNLLWTGLFFTATMMMYDDTDTHKPG
jgi:hypothetical protein